MENSKYYGRKGETWFARKVGNESVANKVIPGLDVVSIEIKDNNDASCRVSELICILTYVCKRD